MEPKVYDIIEFGNYWQDKNSDYGKTPIKWVILDIKDDRMLLLSKYVLDNKQFDDKNENEVTWEKSSLRKWLNNTESLNNSFINNAFNTDEQGRIIPVNTISEMDPIYCCDFGNEACDKIFILNVGDVMEKYLHSDEARIAYPTEYVKNNNVICSDADLSKLFNNGVMWWVRSRGHTKMHVKYVLHNGRLSFCGVYKYSSMVFVRPALWIRK